MRPAYLPIDRYLTDKERNNQLFQKRKAKVKTINLNDNLSVIKLNSTYLETVDKYYKERGVASFFMLIIWGVALYALYAPFYLIVNQSYLGGAVLLIILSLSLAIIGYFAFRKDSFCYTHYPIRFNRKTGKVYALTRDQGELTATWSKLFFTLDSYHPTAISGKEYNVLAHILAEDGKTVINTFELGISSVLKNDVLAYWEFIRRYMEEGADEVQSIVEYCLPLSSKKARLWDELRYLIGYNFEQYPIYLVYISLPFTLCAFIGRAYAMLTSKVPSWSEEVEKANQIEAKAKVNLDSRMNQPWSWKDGWTRDHWWKRRLTEDKDYEPW